MVTLGAGRTISVGASNGSTYGFLFFAPGTGNVATLAAATSASVVLGGSASNQLYDNTGVSTAITIGVGVTVTGGTGSIFPNYSGSTLSIAGTIDATTSGKTVTVGNNTQVTTIASGGIVRASGGILTLAGTWTNNGTIGLSAGTVNLGGTYNETSVQSARWNRGGSGTSGTVNVSGALTIGGTLQHTSTMGVWRLAGCTIKGGTLTSTGGTLVGTSASNVIDGVTFDADLDLAQFNGAQVTIKNVVTLGAGRTISIGASNGSTYGYVFFAPGAGNVATLAAATTASVVLGGSASNQLYDNTGVSTAITIGAGVTVTGGTGAIFPLYSGSTLSIAGTIDAATSGKTVTVGNNAPVTTIASGGIVRASGGILTLAGTWTNNGTIGLSAGTVNLGGTYNETSVQSARWNRGGSGTSGTVNVSGALTIGGTLQHTSTMGVWRLAGCTIKGGTLTSTGGTLVGTNASNVIDGVAFNADLDLAQVNGAQATIKNVVTLGASRTISIGASNGSTYGYLFFAPGTGNVATLAAASAASVVLGGSASNQLYDNTGVSTAITIGAGVTVTGGTGAIFPLYGGSTLAIAGTVDAASAAKTVTIGTNNATTITGIAKASAGILTLAGTWSNSGTLVAQSGGTINLGGSFGYTSILGPRWNRSGSNVVNITGSLAIGTGNSLVLDAQTGPLRLVGGTLTGGIISDPGSRLVCTQTGGVLDGVTIPVGTVLDLSQINGALCTLNNATTIQGSVLVGKVDGSTSGRIYTGSSTATWSGSGDVLFGASTSNQLQVTNASSTLTIASPLRVHGMNVTMYANNSGSGIVNNGTIASDVAGGSFTINANFFTNNGSLTIGQGSAQTWNMTGNFTQSGTGVLDLGIGGAGAGQFDRMAFTGTSTINLGGTVRLTSTNGFVPTAATSLDFLTMVAGSVSGSFTTVQGAYSISYGSNKVTAIGLAGLSAPTVALTSTAADPVLSGSIPVTATFSTAVTGFTAAGVSVSNASIANFSGSGSSYTFDLVPTVSQGLVQAQIVAGAGSSAQLLGSAASTVLQRFFNSVAPTISSVSPNSGPTAGGTSVIISGSGFLAGQTTITIGGAAATASSVTASSFAMTTPAGANGPADVVVTVAGRSVTVTGGYTYSAATPSLASVLLSSEYNALVAFYSATGGANWISSTGWNSTTATSWLGVTVSGNRVIGLTLPNNNLTGVIPAALADFPNLQILDLSGNRLSGTIPPEVTSRTLLTQLSLARNQLVGLIPDAITALTALNGMAIDYNGLYSSGNAATNTFLVLKQANWASTQTVQPAGLTAVNQGSDVLVTWTPIPYTGDSGYYEIGFNTDGSGTYTFNAGNQTVDKSGNQFLITGLAAQTAYFFTVRTRTLAQGTQLNTVVSATPARVSLTTNSPTTPTVTLSSVSSDPATTAPIPVTVTFSEPMTGFSLAGITVSNATAANLVGSGALYTFDLIPTVTQDNVQASVVAAAASSIAFAAGNTASLPLIRFYNGSNPTIGSLTPATGLATGGTAVVITGTNFVPGATTVQIGGTAAVVGAVTATSIQLVTPAGTGAADVVVQSAGRSATSTGGFAYVAIPPAPTATLATTAVDPVTVASIPVTVTFDQSVTGFTASGLVVTNGTIQNFTGSGTAYAFNLVPTVNLQGTVSVSVAAGSAFNAQSLGNLASTILQRLCNGIDPVIVSLTPATGPEAGGTAVVLAGSGFIPGSTSVTIGGASATLGTVTATSINLTVPAGIGTADVVVQCAGRSATSVGGYTYLFVAPAPTVVLSSTATDPTRVSPLPLTITFSQPVSGFTLGSLSLVNATAQQLGGSGTTYTCALVPTVGQGTITVTVPANVVINGQGTGNLASASLQRLYIAPPMVSMALTTVVAPEGAGVAAGSPAAVITVRLTSASTQSITVPFSAVGGTAGNSDYVILTPTPLLFAPGTLSQDIRVALSVDSPDGPGVVPLDESLVLALGTPINADLGATTTATLTIVDEEIFTAVVKVGTGSTQPIPSGAIGLPLTVSVGETMTVRLANGIPPYTVVPSARSRFFAYAPQYVANVNVTVDPDQQALIVALAPGTSQIQLRDSGGAIFALEVTAMALPSFTLPAPPVFISTGDATLYGAICPGTSEGLTRLLAALSGRSAADARAFWWNASVQQYREISTDTTSGLTPTSAIFLATRSELNLDFSGGAQPFYQELALPPGWSFVGLPPLGDGVTTTTLHDWMTLVLFDDQGDQITGAQRNALIGTGAYFWDGAAYVLSTTLNSGAGYWIKNNSSPGQPLRLVRFPNGADVNGVSLRSADEHRNLVYGRVPAPGLVTRRLYGAVDRGTPPSPPGSAASTNQESAAGGCGAGGVAASIVLILTLGFRRRRL